jgi:hypothetical protein
MNLTLTDELRKAAQRCISFEPPEMALPEMALPEVALKEPGRIAAYIFTYGSQEDVMALRCQITQDDLQRLLDAAPPGIYDPPLLGLLEPDGRSLHDAANATTPAWTVAPDRRGYRSPQASCRRLANTQGSRSARSTCTFVARTQEEVSGTALVKAVRMNKGPSRSVLASC